MFTCPVLGSVFAGIAADKQLGTAPWLTLIFMFIGLAFAVYATYRVATRVAGQSTTSKQKQEERYNERQ